MSFISDFEPLTFKEIFTISDKAKAIYNNTIVVKNEWELSFVGAIAIPNAAASYSKLAELLLQKLYSDKTFINSLKNKR